ncbi:hypothetical protein EBS02_00825 [bacterium]|nr:hypothetical protein [bacterium]
MSESLPKSNGLFVVSSAIHTKHGVYSPEERLDQLIKTCESIRERTTCDIVIVDGGEKFLSIEEQNKLNGVISHFYSYYDTPLVKELRELKIQDVVKNVIEVFMFGSFFHSEVEKIKHYGRVFKLSGRYTLTNEFDYNYHIKQRDRIVIRGPYTSQFTPEITGGVRLQYMSRLWSFDAALIEYMVEVYKHMLKNMIETVNSGGYIDIEHSLFKFLDPKIVVTPEKIGVVGNLAPNGATVTE